MQRFARLARLACVLLLACAGAPRAEPGTALVFGSVRLVPKAGAERAPASYGDRRLRDVARVDYQHPGFSVVFADAAGAPAAAALAPAALALEARAGRVRFAPAVAATDLAHGVAVSNRSGETRIVSAPAAGFVEALAPGETAQIAPSEAGELELHVLGVSAAPAVVFVAPGAFAQVGADGRYELRGLAPGAREIRAWHPRLPVSGARRVDVAAGAAFELDLEIGVDLAEKGTP
jgi:hypothetical protein